LTANALNDARPKIVLFDEIQRFNTLDHDGRPLQNTKFTDFWELLSDGRLSRRERANVDALIGDMAFFDRDLRRRKDRGEEVNVEEGIGLWEARNLKEQFGLDGAVEDLADLSRRDMLARLGTARDRKVIYEPVDHSQTLIVISGNLDDAFAMANQTAEADVDADIFRAFTEKITVVDIKHSLSRRFKPEQVARFGNVHLIYRSLGRADFTRLIEREIARVEAMSSTHFGIELRVDPSVADLVYRNGVFAVQGVRPVFSSVADIVETNLSKLLFEALLAGDTRVDLRYDTRASQLVGRLSGDAGERATMTVPYVGRLDRVRERNVVDLVANVSVHEAGHAVAYGVLFGLAPLQLTAKVAASYAAGFTFPHDIHDTAGNLLRKAQVYLAGGLAEEVVFGAEQATVGRGADREAATQLVLDFIRRYGFDPEFQASYVLDGPWLMDRTVTDVDAEKLVVRLVADTRQLLESHHDLLVDLAAQLRVAGKLEASQVAVAAARHGLDLRVEAEGHLHIPGYAAGLDRAG
jgi:cell division protease FtsH